MEAEFLFSSSAKSDIFSSNSLVLPSTFSLKLLNSALTFLISPLRTESESVFFIRDSISVPTFLIWESKLSRGSVFVDILPISFFRLERDSALLDTFLSSSRIFSVLSEIFIIILVLFLIESRLSATLCIILLVSGIDSCF